MSFLHRLAGALASVLAVLSLAGGTQPGVAFLYKEAADLGQMSMKAIGL